MNKKFSTLVASLLLTSAFSVYSVDAKPMLATPTQVETRAAAADVEDAVEWTGSALSSMTIPASIADQVLNGFTNNSALVAIALGTNGYVYGNGTLNNVFNVGANSTTVTNRPHFYWRYINGHLINNADQTFSYMGDKDYFEIIPLTENNVPTKFFVLGSRDNNGNLKYICYDNTLSKWTDNTNLSNATLFVSVETEYTDLMTATELNDELGGGFNLSVTSKIDESVTVAGAEVFNGKLTAATQGSGVQITNEDGLLIVFEKSGIAPSDPVAEQGEFKLIKPGDFNSATQVREFKIYAADNGSDDVYVEINGARLYIAHVRDTYSLSYVTATAGIDNINYANTSLSVNNYANMKQFLQGKFVTVDFVDADMSDPNNAYKVGGRLAVLTGDGTTKPDYVAADGLYEKAPEAQWAVTAHKNSSNVIDGIILTNRENPDQQLTINALRVVKGNIYETTAPIAGTNIGANEQIRISFVEDHSKTDGYAVFSDNDLKNETYYLGQVRQAEGEAEINVYWTENHTASHQIGATVEEANATKWNLSLVKKAHAGDDYKNQTDSILVVTNLDTWVAEKSRIETKQDTLVILPYAFQNRSNSEYVMFNGSTNLNYYECDAPKAAFNYDKDAIFALKLKADGNYNYVPVAPRKNDGSKVYYNNDGGVVAVLNTNATYKQYASEKVFQENSTYKGTWGNMDMYAKNANSLMFVTKVQAPEYRKLVTTANLDTIKLYRADNEAQVVYEKKDPKSIVEGDTLSFLNIDNDAQFTTINPALYADTAYVNRGDNTCWQYLLGVNIEHKEGYYCPEHGFGETEPCTHAVWVSYNKGRYLMNMIDTANVYGKTAGIHNNPYINETEEGLTCAKLSFVDAIHVLTDEVNPAMSDKLYVINNGDTTAVDLGTPDFNTVKFAFKYTDSMESDEFKIQTQWKEYDPTTYGTGAYNNKGANFSQEGYLRWVNGCIVVDNGYEKGDVFNMNEDETRTPTANEEISAEEATVSVVATDGAVIVKGAEGKNVIVSTILGKVVANEVVNSDNETIAAPAGIVVVSVDGESFKVAVK